MIALPKTNDANKRLFVRGVLDAQPAQSVDRIAVFCHGTQRWCDLGITTATVSQIAPNLDRVFADGARIGLYCCLTGALSDGLAARLSASLMCPVLSHTTSGHTTRNPNKRMFSDGVARYLMPTDRTARRAWINYLKQKNAPFEALETN